MGIVQGHALFLCGKCTKSISRNHKKWNKAGFADSCLEAGLVGILEAPQGIFSTRRKNKGEKSPENY